LKTILKKIKAANPKQCINLRKEKTKQHKTAAVVAATNYIKKT